MFDPPLLGRVGLSQKVIDKNPLVVNDDVVCPAYGFRSAVPPAILTRLLTDLLQHSMQFTVG